jgi:hypothetical protein
MKIVISSILLGILLSTTAQAQTSRPIVPGDVGIQVPFGAVGDVLVAGPTTSKVQDSSACPSGTCNLPNGLTIAPTAALGQGIVTSQSGSGTGPNTYPNAGYVYNFFNINDGVKVSGLGGPSIGMEVNQALTSSANGNHTAIMGSVRIVGTTTADSNAGSYVSLWGYSAATSASSGGSIYGANPQVVLGSGATGWNVASGMELDMSVDTAASVGSEIGLNITKLGAGNQGSVHDVAIEIAANSTNLWKTGIEFGNFNGVFGIATTGTVIGTGGVTGTVAYGIDFSNLTCSSNCFISPSFSVSGSGAITGASVGVTSTAFSNTGIYQFAAGVLGFSAGNNAIAYWSTQQFSFNFPSNREQSFQLTNANAGTAAQSTLYLGNSTSTVEAEITLNGGSATLTNGANAMTISTAGALFLQAGSNTQGTNVGVKITTGTVSLPSVATGTPVASLCIDASNNIIKKTTAGSCI